jgi:hypothetical protein
LGIETCVAVHSSITVSFHQKFVRIDLRSHLFSIISHFLIPPDLPSPFCGPYREETHRPSFPLTHSRQ